MKSSGLSKRGLAVAVTAVAVVMMVSGCESARKAFGGKKNSPDEFAVYSRPPLSLPPDYGLRPPKPGVSRPQRVSPTDVAKAAMYGDRTKKPVQKAPAGKMSPGLKALLRDTGGLTADPSIRARIEEETTVLAEEDQRFIDKLIFWVDDKPYQGTIVDPGKEEKRIREADALGEPITRGDTERVRRKRPKKGLLEF